MAERREKKKAILLRFPGKTRIFELFPAEQWPDQHEADTGLFRLCECEYVDGKKKSRWISLGGQKYTFFTLQAINQLLLKELAEPGTLEALERPKPKLRQGQWVRWHGPNLSSRQVKLGSEPFLWIDGQWRAWISVHPHGPRMVCCNELTPVDAFGKEVPHG